MMKMIFIIIFHKKQVNTFQVFPTGSIESGA